MFTLFLLDTFFFIGEGGMTKTQDKSGYNKYFDVFFFNFSSKISFIRKKVIVIKKNLKKSYAYKTEENKIDKTLFVQGFKFV